MIDLTKGLAVVACIMMMFISSYGSSTSAKGMEKSFERIIK